MALGDIVSVSVNPTAWQAVVTVSGMGTSGNYNLGLGNFNSVSSPNQPKIVLNLISSGYDENGFPTTLPRTIYGTKQVRLPYPNDAVIDEVVAGGNVTLKFALSDFIYQKDASITANILTGLYYSGSIISSGVANYSVTNESNLAYPKTIANWTWPNYDVITGSTFNLRCVAFNRFAQSGRPVRLVKFWARDTGAGAVTGIVRDLTIDGSMPDRLKVQEYVCNLSAANLTQGSRVTGNFIAYPWIGDTGSLLDTSDGVNAYPTPLYAPTTLLCDKNGTYGKAIAVVNPSTGNNNAATVVNSSSFNAGSPPASYLSIGAAITGIKNFNNSNFSRNDVGNGVVYLQSGSYAFVGATLSAPQMGNEPDTYITIAGYPGHNKSAITITGGGGTTNVGEKMKVQGVSITGNTNIIFQGMDNLWLDQNYFYCTGTNTQAAIGVVPTLYFTHNEVEELRQGIASAGAPSQNTNPAVVRGNLLNNYVRQVVFYTCVGNIRTGRAVNQTSFFTDVSGAAVKTPDNAILAFNAVYNFTGLSLTCVTADAAVKSHGVAIVQNVFEKTIGAGLGVAEVASAATAAEPYHNFIIWHNDFIGERQQMCYNEVGNVPTSRGINWSVKNNATENYACKTDAFGTPPTGTRTGNWSQVYAVGQAGNAKGKINVSSNLGEESFLGINTITGHGLSTGYYEYVSPGSAFIGNGSIVAFRPTGNGNYNIKSSSPLINLPIDHLLPYDMAGNPRTSTSNSAGAFIYYIVSVAADGRVSYNGVGDPNGCYRPNSSFGVYMPN